METTTAMNLIRKERDEQINKHNYTIKYDRKTYIPGDLLTVAELIYNWDGTEIKDVRFRWVRKIATIHKPKRDRLIIAGAFCLAEKDAFPNRYDSECDDLLATIVAELSE